MPRPPRSVFVGTVHTLWARPNFDDKGASGIAQFECYGHSWWGNKMRKGPAAHPAKRCEYIVPSLYYIEYCNYSLWPLWFKMYIFCTSFWSRGWQRAQIKSNHLLMQQKSTCIGNINITNMFTKWHKCFINLLTAVITLF